MPDVAAAYLFRLPEAGNKAQSNSASSNFVPTDRAIRRSRIADAACSQTPDRSCAITLSGPGQLHRSGVECPKAHFGSARDLLRPNPASRSDLEGGHDGRLKARLLRSHLGN